MEGKDRFEGKSGGRSLDDDEPEECIQVSRIEFARDSALCPVEDPLGFTVHFEALRPLQDATWQVKYLVDAVTNQYVKVLGRTEACDYSGESQFTFSVPKVDISHIPTEKRAAHLSNVGLLICALSENDDPEQEIAELKMVVQVTPQQRTGQDQDELIRCIFNPFPEGEE